MADDHVRNGSSTGEDQGLSTVAPIDEAAAEEGSGDSLDQMDPPELANGKLLDSFGNETNETRATEDGARDDMFVDCPDEIENSESQQSSEEKDICVQDDHFNESDSGIKIQHLMAEMERLRDSYENSVAEKENYEAERTMFMREIADLRSQLEVYNEHQIQASEITYRQLEKDQQFNVIVNRILGSLSMTLHQEEFSDESPEQKIFNVEKSVTSLVEKYNLFLSETDRLREYLVEIGSEFDMMDEIGTLAFARDKFLELKEKENSLSQNISYLENENKELVEKLEKQRSIVENANAEIGRLNLEVEQERHRYANTKEKLGMAVTKGKALVQQRDSLKQFLAEKSSELEKCSIELQEKSNALEAAEQRNELLASNEKLATFLKESLAEKENTLQKCEEILSEVAEIEELQSTYITEKLSWLVEEYKSLTKLTDSFNLCKEENQKLQSEMAEMKEASNQEIERQTALLMEETRERSNLQAELEDLRNMYEAYEKLHHELAETREAANIEIDRLTKSLVTESQEKNYLEAELEDLRRKYEEIVEKEYQASFEKDQIVNVLLEASGLANDHSDINGTVNNCIAKIKEKTCQIESPQIDMQIFESFQSLLYVTDMEMRLCKLISVEDLMSRTEANRLSHEMGIITQEFSSVKDEKAVMQKSIEQLEARCGLLKDKLSMAVKKGKGLVQERENLKGSINEKNSEIDKLKSELQQSLSAYNECQDKITELSLAVERVSQLESSLIETKERADQLEQFLAESNNMLQRVMESIEDINSPGDFNVEQPVEKVKWLAEYIRESESKMIEMEHELKNVKDEASSLAGNLLEARSSIESLEDALSTAENNLSHLFNEKKELEVSKAVLEEEFQKEKENAYFSSSKFEEVSLSKKALEDALSTAENNLSRLFNEKKELEVSKSVLVEELQKEKENASVGTNKFEEVLTSKRALEEALQLAENEREIALESKVLMEEQLHKLKDEFATHINKLSDADKSTQSLEEALSQAQNNISLLAEENNKLEISRADLESEIKKMTEEATSQVTKLSDALLTIQSLQDAFSNAENNMNGIVQEKENLEQEILTLRSKLNSCMEELSGTRGSIQNRSADISGQLSRLQLLLQDDNLSSTVDQCFSSKIESLNKIDFVIKEMRHCFLEMHSDALQNTPVMEDDTSVSTTLPSHPNIALNTDTNNVVNAVDGESIKFYIEKMNEHFQLKDKMLADKFDNFSTLMDESIAHLSKRLHVTKDVLMSTMNYVTSLKQQVKDMEKDKQRQGNTISSLENDIRILSSACFDATRVLDSNLHKNLSKLKSVHELVELEDKVFTDLAEFEVDTEATPINGDYVKLAEKLLLITRHNQDLNDLIQVIITKLFGKTDDLQNKLRSLGITFHEVSEERDLYKDNISKLEIDLESQQNLSEEMELKIHDYEEKQDHLTKRVAELSSLPKTQELENSLLSVSQVKSILSKINEVEFSDSAFSVGEAFDSSADVRKLFYVIDNYIESQRNVNSLSHEKEELQSTIEKQILEIESREKKIKEHMDNEKDSEKMFTDLLELESGLKSIVQKMGGNDLIDGQKATGVIYLLPVLDKLVMAKLMEFENLQSKNEEIVIKLRGNEKLVDDLSNKVKLLEDSNQVRSVPLEIEERGTSLPSLSTQSEISEIQDMGGLGKKSNNVTVVPSAASLRTLRKGSSDHLTINIDSDSERLINNKEPDDDKGHVFKSLNTSGLIPRQGRTVADRVDGIWVSGSRALMSHPRGRLGLIAYWLVLHIWLLGAIL